tara:strand:- start:404 stop:775 length:372 start_codon:yes stop_codon:yes gene_type:complete
MIKDWAHKIVNQEWHQKTYKYILYISYILFGFAFTGVVTINPAYLATLENILKYYVSFFLILRFNPFFNKPAKSNREKFDRYISYSAGVFLLLSTALTSAAEIYFKKINHWIHRKVPIPNLSL